MTAYLDIAERLYDYIKGEDDLPPRSSLADCYAAVDMGNGFDNTLKEALKLMSVEADMRNNMKHRIKIIEATSEHE